MDSASTVGISLSELVAVAVALIGVLWLFGKLALSQFRALLDARFASIDSKLRSFDPLHGELTRIDRELVAVRLEMATAYVRQDGLQRLDEKITRLFGEVFNKLDSKADKSECDKVHRQ